MNILDVLSSSHDITLLTSSNIDLDSLNEDFGTNVKDITVLKMEFFNTDLHKIINDFTHLFSGKPGYLFSIFTQALYNRQCTKYMPDGDLLINTWGEVTAEKPAIHYIHSPYRYGYLRDIPPNFEYDITSSMKFIANYIKLVGRKLGVFDKSRTMSDKLLVNSDWTRKKIKYFYDANSSVLYPPIDTENISNSLNWKDREDGFVSVSRISPNKNIVWLIEILDEVRQRGHNIHYHIVGPRDTESPKYFDKVASLAKEHDFVTMEGPIYDKKLYSIMEKHKFGINGHLREQFGMSIAEMVAAGMVPFVPNGGGQKNIVGENEKLMFNHTEEAVKKISAIIEDDVSASNLRKDFPDIEKEFSKSKFQEYINELVECEVRKS
jgi:glycosyltransferase involved in cell wall biosynthesis